MLTLENSGNLERYSASKSHTTQNTLSPQFFWAWSPDLSLEVYAQMDIQGIYVFVQSSHILLCQCYVSSHCWGLQAARPLPQLGSVLNAKMNSSYNSSRMRWFLASCMRSGCPKAAGSISYQGAGPSQGYSSESGASKARRWFWDSWLEGSF